MPRAALICYVNMFVRGRALNALDHAQAAQVGSGMIEGLGDTVKAWQKVAQLDKLDMPASTGGTSNFMRDGLDNVQVNEVIKK